MAGSAYLHARCGFQKDFSRRDLAPKTAWWQGFSRRSKPRARSALARFPSDAHAAACLPEHRALPPDAPALASLRARFLPPLRSGHDPRRSAVARAAALEPAEKPGRHTMPPPPHPYGTPPTKLYGTQNSRSLNITPNPPQVATPGEFVVHPQPAVAATCTPALRFSASGLLSRGDRPRPRPDLAAGRPFPAPRCHSPASPPPSPPPCCSSIPCSDAPSRSLTWPARTLPRAGGRGRHRRTMRGRRWRRGGQQRASTGRRARRVPQAPPRRHSLGGGRWRSTAGHGGTPKARPARAASRPGPWVVPRRRSWQARLQRRAQRARRRLRRWRRASTVAWRRRRGAAV